MHRRRFPALQFCHPERFRRHRVHAQAAGELERWLQDGDGQGSCAAIKEGCGSIAENRWFTLRRFDVGSNNGVRSCWQPSSTPFTDKLAGNISPPCGGAGPEAGRVSRNLSLPVELFSNDQSCKRSDLRIWRFHAARHRYRLFRRTGVMRRGPEPAPIRRTL